MPRYSNSMFCKFQIDSRLLLAKKNKNAATASKVQLMRIKNKATGLKSIPLADRVYFNLQRHRSNEVHPVFISKCWTIGRAIDAMASELKMQNNNHKSEALKLRLFKKDDLSILSVDLTQSIESLIKSNSIIDGDDLILEYVSNDCVSLSK